MTKLSRREHKRHSTGDPWLDLLGAVIRQALRDAKRDLAAAAWVRSVAPALASRIGNGSEKQRKKPEVNPQDARHSTKKAKRYKHTTTTAIVEPGPSCWPEITVVTREDRQMSYEAQLQAAQSYNPHAANDAQIRYERMSKEERAEYDAQKRAAIAALAAEAQAKQDARRAALAAAHLADEAKRRAAKEAAARDRARRLWAGDDASFDRQWPAMYEQMLAQQTTEQMQRASKEQFDFLVSRF